MEKPVVTMYYRHGCHLCEDMLQQLMQLQTTEIFLLDTIDVDIDKNLQEHYGSLVPVLEGGGEELCHYYLDEMTLRGYLSSQASKVS